MRRKLCGLSGTLLVLGFGASCASSALADTKALSEEVIVHDAPYTIHRQLFGRALSKEMAFERITVEKDVSYADLDLSKEVDFDTMKIRVRQAAADGCRELHRRFPTTQVGERGCVGSATGQALARLDGLRAPVR